MKEKAKGLRTWIEVDEKAVKHNVTTFRSLLDKKVKLMAVVKSNAYGHGLWDFAKILVKNNIDWLAVDSVVEGLALRREGVHKPILVLGYTLPEMYELAAKNNISITISSFDNFRYLKNLRFGIKIHIKVDTGMHRHGFSISDSSKLVKDLKSLKYVTIEGLYTHFASAKNPALAKDTLKQISEFEKWREIFKDNYQGIIFHASATGGTLLFKDAHFDMVRVGIGIYGLWPAVESKSFLKDKITLKPVLRWKSIIAEIKTLEKGERIGYDFTEKIDKRTTVGIIPIGYWHGYPRALSGIGRVYVSGKSCKVLGRVCMDIIMIDISAVNNARTGQEVEIVSQNESSDNSVCGLSELAGTSAYELVTRINPLIKRIVV